VNIPAETEALAPSRLCARSNCCTNPKQGGLRRCGASDSPGTAVRPGWLFRVTGRTNDLLDGDETVRALLQRACDVGRCSTTSRKAAGMKPRRSDTQRNLECGRLHPRALRSASRTTSRIEQTSGTGRSRGHHGRRPGTAPPRPRPLVAPERREFRHRAAASASACIRKLRRAQLWQSITIRARESEHGPFQQFGAGIELPSPEVDP
jgi:hypothetical protein